MRTTVVLVALAGCSPYDHGELLRHETLVHDGMEREFHLYASEAEGPRPLVVALHGGFATIDAFIGRGTGAAPFGGMWLQVADEEGFHVVVPQGIDKHWNDCRADCEHCPEVDDAAFLLALIDHVSDRIEVDPDHVHVAGESNGGFMTQRMALEHGEDFGGLGVVIASMAADDQCGDIEAAVPMVYVVGTEDWAVPYEGGPSGGDGTGTMVSSDDTMAHWVQRNQCDPTPTVEDLDDLDPDDGSTVTREAWTCGEGALERYVAEGGGHVVPSVEEEVTAFWEGLAGEQNHDLETVRAMWSFFEANPR